MLRDNYKTVKEIANEWGVTLRSIQIMCVNGKIPGAKKMGKIWVVPADTVRPFDNRRVVGNPELRKNNEKLEKILRKKSIKENNKKAISIMTHHLRTSLNAIMGYSDILMNNVNDPEKVTECVKEIQKSGKGILEFSENLIQVERIFTGEEKLEEEPCNVIQLLQDVQSGFAEEASNREISITMDVDVEHEHLMVDVEKLRRIFKNILSNAVQYSNDKSSIVITVKEEDATQEGKAKIHYSIRDHGIGMTDKFQRHIFDVFAKENEAAKSGSGQGLGMPIVKLLTDMMDGKITVESHIGFGTLVEITLEQDIVMTPEEAAGEALEGDYSELVGKRVLLAEDNPINRAIAESMLQDVGVQVECAADGIICLAMIDQHESGYYDCVLMDLQMPNMDGMEATAIIRGMVDKRKANIPVFAMTASVLHEYKENAEKVGMDGFIEKPVDKKKLYRVMKSINK